MKDTPHDLILSSRCCIVMSAVPVLSRARCSMVSTRKMRFLSSTSLIRSRACSSSSTRSVGLMGRIGGLMLPRWCLQPFLACMQLSCSACKVRAFPCGGRDVHLPSRTAISHLHVHGFEVVIVCMLVYMIGRM